MTVREWLSIPVCTWRSQRERHRELQEAFRWHFDRYPFWKRLWYRHLYRLPLYLRVVFAQYRRLAQIKYLAAYCIVADRLTGTRRYERFIEEREKEIAGYKDRAARNLARLQEAYADGFRARLRFEAAKHHGFIPRERNTIQ